MEPQAVLAVIDPFIASLIVGLILTAASIVLSELLRPKPEVENARPGKDFSFPTAEEGRVIPILFGTEMQAAMNVVWWGDRRQKKIKETLKTGLFSSETVVRGFKYFVGWQGAVSAGQIDNIRRVFIGDVEVFSGTVQDGTIDIDEPKLFGGKDSGGGVQGTLRVFSGGEGQALSTYLADFQDPLPSYSGTAYVLWEGGYIGNSTQIKPWKFEIQRFPNQLGLGGNRHIVNNFDANPACVLYELLTDDDWGFGFSSGNVNVTSLQDAGDTLFDEGNGFSFLMDTPMEAADFLRELERQIDGIVYLDRRTGQFNLQLTRGGYDVDAIPQIVDNTNMKAVTDFTRGTWDSTTNQVMIGFEDRQREYKTTFAAAQDLANQRIQGGERVAVQMQFPGVKDKDLAAQLASRELKGLSAPLAKATVQVDRTMSGLNPGDVVALSDSTLGVVKFPMRVLSANFGTLEEGTITLGLVQDIFEFAQPFSAPPDGTRWTFPQQDVVAPPADEVKVFEAPYAFAARDPDFPGLLDRLWATARNQNGIAVSQFIYQRNDPTTPAGAFTENGEVFGFVLIGELAANLNHAAANPSTVVIQLDPSPDTVADMLDEVLASTSASDVGGPLLRNLLLIDDEMLGATVVTDQTTHIDLNGVYRGMLDSSPADHAAGAKVWLLTAGGGLSSSGIPQPNVVDVQVRPSSPMDDATELESATIQFQMNNRARRPYPPVELSLNGDRYPAQVDIDDTKTGGTTLDSRGIEATFTRRDFRTPDEVLGITTDAETLDPTFPAANSTTYKMRVIEDPLGAATVLFETDLNSGEALVFASRTKILRETGGAIPSTLAVEVVSSHTFNGVVYESTQSLDHTFNSVSGTLDNDTNMGVLALNVIGASYTAPATGSINFTVGTALPSGAVEARVNGGAFSTIISATNTTGTLVGVSAGDSVQVRHTQSGDNSNETFLFVDTPGNNVDAYAVLTH